jgi:hypothetical protein
MDRKKGMVELILGKFVWNAIWGKFIFFQRQKNLAESKIP